jgi:protein-tyrosine-phosphatase/glycosyltransferase involved in cell wall biosynthesis
MRILWVKVGGIWPPETGGRIRTFHLISELARRHRVILATTHVPGEDPGAGAASFPACERILSLPARIPKRGSLRFLLALARSWPTRLPLDLAKFRVPELAREVRRACEAGGIDLCVADFLSATVNVPLGGPVPVLLFAHNVEHVIWKRLARSEPRLWRRAALEIEWRKLRAAEARACALSTLTAAVSEPDRERLARLSPDARVEAIPTGVDTTYFTPDAARERPGRLVFTGSMDWHPNEDAMLHFIEAILPRVRRAFPGASLTVAGRGPGPRLLEAAARAGVRVTGRVDDIRPHLAEGMVYVVPLRIGGGTRLKIFEALAMGKAVVSTTIGAEGLPLVPGVHFLQEDDPERFAAGVVALLGDPGLRRSLGRAGRDLVEARASWPRVADEFESCCAEAVDLHRLARRDAAAALSTRARLRRLLPAPLLRDLRACRDLGAQGRSIYWRSRLRRALGPDARAASRRGAGAGRAREPAGGPGETRSILFVCRGNVIRSPMAAAILEGSSRKTGIPAPEVSSAGVRAARGAPADERARVVAREFGVCLDRHRSRALTDEMVRRADRIVALDSLVEAEILARHPWSRSKVGLLQAAARGGEARPIEIADPFDGDLAAVRRCFRRLRSALESEAAGPPPRGDARRAAPAAGEALRGTS